jgi:hypothetical protein
MDLHSSSGTDAHQPHMAPPFLRKPAHIPRPPSAHKQLDHQSSNNAARCLPSASVQGFWDLGAIGGLIALGLEMFSTSFILSIFEIFDWMKALQAAASKVLMRKRLNQRE